MKGTGGGRLRSRKYFGHFSTPGSLLKLRISPKCRFAHALPRRSGRRAQLQKKVAFLSLTRFKICRYFQGGILNPHLMFKIISNDFCQIRPVGRNIVWLISRRPEGARGWELHHKNRRIALSPSICVRRSKSLILILHDGIGSVWLKSKKYFGHFGVVI